MRSFLRLVCCVVCGLAFAPAVHADDQLCDPSPAQSCVDSAEPPPVMLGEFAANASTLPPVRGTLGWVPRAALPLDRLRTLPEYCDGTYVEPAFMEPMNSDAESFPTRIQASDLQYWLQDRAELRGSVEVTRGNQSLIAADATFDDVRRSVTVDDGVLLRQPGLLIEGRAAELKIDTGAARVWDGQFVLHENGLRGSGQLLERNASGDFFVTGGSFTRCEPGNESWRVTSSAVRVDDNAKYGTARHAVLRVRNVPVFYTPYIRFPVTDERMSGWLFPDVGLSDTNGTDIAVPYYLNLAPNYDATLTPRSIAERGVAIEGTARHMSNFGSADVGGAFLPEDDIYNGRLSRDDYDELGLAEPFEPADRWLFRVEQLGFFGENLRTRIDSTKVSDFDYFRDFGSNLATASQVEVQQFGEVVYARDGWSTGAWVQDFQRLDVDVVEPYKRVPELDLSYQSQLRGPMSWSVDSSWARFDRSNDQFVGIDRINGDRLSIEPRVRLPLDWSSAYSHLVSGYRYTRYQLEDVPLLADKDPERKIWFGSLDSGLFFERDASVFGASGVQTLEPRLYYLYQQYRDQNQLPQFDVSDLGFTFDQLFRDNRFAGIDRIGDANQLTAAVTTRWLDAQTSEERARASIGQIRYFEDRRVAIRGGYTGDDRQSTSAMAAQVGAALGRALSIRTNATWDPNDNKWEELGSWLQYRRDNRHIFNVGYRRLDGPLLKQSDISAYWSVARHWSLIGRFNYDYVEHRTIDGFYGLEYSDCCWQVRLFGRNFLVQADNRLAADAESDKGAFFQIVFKGLAGFGGRVDSIMQAGIPGYVAEEF